MSEIKFTEEEMKKIQDLSDKSGNITNRFGKSTLTIKKVKTKDEIDLEETKNILLNAEKNKKLTMHSKAHYNKLKQSILINYNIK